MRFSSGWKALEKAPGQKKRGRENRAKRENKANRPCLPPAPAFLARGIKQDPPKKGKKSPFFFKAGLPAFKAGSSLHPGTAKGYEGWAAFAWLLAIG